MSDALGLLQPALVSTEPEGTVLWLRADMGCLRLLPGGGLTPASFPASLNSRALGGTAPRYF